VHARSLFTWGHRTFVFVGFFSPGGHAACIIARPAPVENLVVISQLAAATCQLGFVKAAVRPINSRRPTTRTGPSGSGRRRHALLPVFPSLCDIHIAANPIPCTPTPSKNDTLTPLYTDSSVQQVRACSFLRE
jgi:hypothetical protein